LSTTTSRSRHSTATLDGGGGGLTPSYSPEEADTHFKRYSGGGRLAAVTTVQEPKLPDPEEDGAAAMMSAGILNGEAAGRVDEEKAFFGCLRKEKNLRKMSQITTRN
jgi:hypothetical protein